MSESTENVARGSLLSAAEIAELAGVTPSAVSNWRKRFSDFPAPIGTAPGGGDLFELAAVEGWLEQRDRASKKAARPGPPIEQLWAVAEQLRGRALGGELIGAVAAGALFIHLVREREGVPRFYEQDPHDLVGWTRKVATQIEAELPELGGFFEPLALVDAHSLRLLLDSLSRFEDSAELAAALDFVIERGTRYGEFRTPEPVAALLAAIAEPHGVVFDPALGSAGFLIHAARVSHDPLDLYGQEINESTWRIALARLLLRHLRAYIARGDSLREDRFPDLRADVVICEPPAGHRTADLSYATGDPRWQFLGTLDAPPPRAGDFTWLAHVIYHLAPNGRGYVLLPRGSLVRAGAEARYRAELLRQGAVEAIVALPGGSLAATAAPPVLWIVRPPTRTPDDVLVIDASGESTVTPELQARLGEAITTWRRERDVFEPTAGFASDVPVLELLAGDAVLTPNRWLYEPALVDPKVLIAEVDEAQHALEHARAQVAPNPPQVTLVPVTEAPARVRVGDLVELGVAALLRPARLKTAQFGDEGLPVWLPADVREPWRRDEQPQFVDPALVNPRSITEPSDIVFTTVGGIRARVDEEGGHVLGTSLHALRLKDRTLDPHLVAALLTSEPNRRLLMGTTIPRVNLLELEIPRLDAAAAAQAVEVLRSLEHELESAHAVVSQAERLREAFVEALAAGATELDDPKEIE